jgi:radical SAM superfamily enzyme with C-terminal helix-hairpin-helix motif
MKIFLQFRGRPPVKYQIPVVLSAKYTQRRFLAVVGIDYAVRSVSKIGQEVTIESHS